MNMISDDRPPIQPIVLNCEPIQKLPKVTAWDWVKYYAYNLSRKPKVWKAQRRLTEIADGVKGALKRDVYPLLESRLQHCEGCRDAYMALKPQIFLSQIETILTRVKCPAHPRVFENFWMVHEAKFQESEELAAWINGFGK